MSKFRQPCIFGLIILGSIIYRIGYADCIFRVNNNSRQTLVVRSGLFHQNYLDWKIAPSTSNSVVLKGNWSCFTQDEAGLGLAYINLITDKSTGGWVYDPTTNVIRAWGNAEGSVTGNIGKSPNGTLLLLNHNVTPNRSLFVVQVNNASRNISRQFGSSN